MLIALPQPRAHQCCSASVPPVAHVLGGDQSAVIRYSSAAGISKRWPRHRPVEVVDHSSTSSILADVQRSIAGDRMGVGSNNREGQEADDSREEQGDEHGVEGGCAPLAPAPRGGMAPPCSSTSKGAGYYRKSPQGTFHVFPLPTDVLALHTSGNAVLRHRFRPQYQHGTAASPPTTSAPCATPSLLLQNREQCIPHHHRMQAVER